MTLYHTIASPTLTWVQARSRSVFAGKNQPRYQDCIEDQVVEGLVLFNLAGREDGLKAAVEKDWWYN